MAREFIVPGQIITGNGALQLAKASLRQMGNRALVVTDQMMVDLKNYEKVESILNELGIACTVYAGINGEPTDVMVEEGLAVYCREECDFIIAIGGGSPIDAMKAIAALVEKGGSIADYMGKEIDVNMPPMVAVPTTAGTGSEATQFTIITDTIKDVKMLLRGRVLIPDLAVIDPMFTLTAPPKVTAATGLDALCHSVEAYTSRKSQTLSDTFALSAVRRIFKNLPAAFHNGADTGARNEMAVAALEAGIAFNNASVTLIHGMSRPIGALFHIAHGLSNAMLMEECLSFALSGAYERFGELGRMIGAAELQADDKTAAQAFINAVKSLIIELEIPTLAEYGIDRTLFMDAVKKMTQDAMMSGSPQNTIRDIRPEDIEQMYKNLWQ